MRATEEGMLLWEGSQLENRYIYGLSIMGQARAGVGHDYFLRSDEETEAG